MKINIIPRHHGGFFRLLLIVFPVLILIFFFACEEPDEIGLGFIDNTVSINTSGLKVIAYSVSEDSVPTNYTKRNLLGYRNDPVFGSKKASIHTEFRLAENNLYLGDDPILDSVVLELYYSGYYGDYTTRQNVKVYELSENFPETDDNIFYSTLKLEHEPVPIADTLVRPIVKDSIRIGDFDLAPQMRIRLSENFGQKLIEGSNSREHFADNVAFLEYFKGLYITVDDLQPNEEGAILYFNLVAADGLSLSSNIRLFYHFEGDTISSSRMFPISEFSNRSTYIDFFDHESAHEYLYSQIILGDTLYGDSLLFLQSMGGADVFINFPKDSLLSLAQDNVVINMAKLIIPIDDQFGLEDYYSEDTPITNNIFLLKNNEEGELSHIIDSHYGYYGGFYDETNKEYIINITQHFQDLLKNPDSNYGMTIVIADSHSNSNRVVLKGPGCTVNPLRLELKYSILD